MERTPADRSSGSRRRRRTRRWLLVLLFLGGATTTPLTLTVGQNRSGHHATASTEGQRPASHRPAESDDHAYCLACVLLLFPGTAGGDRTFLGSAPEPPDVRYAIAPVRPAPTTTEARAPPECAPFAPRPSANG